MTQDDEVVSFDVCSDDQYRENMSLSLQEGMVMVLSQWGKHITLSCVLLSSYCFFLIEPNNVGATDYNEMDWLDERTGCEPEGGVVGCDIDNAVAVFSDIVITYD